MASGDYPLSPIRYSLFAIRYSLFAIRHSLFAIRHSRSYPADRMLFVIVGVFGALRPAGMAAPGDVARGHVGAVAHPEQQRALRAVLVFVHFAGRMDDEGAGLDRDGLVRRAHGAAAFEAEIDFGGVRVAMIGADLAGLPARHGDVAVRDGAEDFFDVLFRVELGLAGDAENMHGRSPRIARRLLLR